VDKRIELWHLSKVFGTKTAELFDPGEQPDFTLRTPDGLVLGVEVTSIFPSNAAAKLKMDREYFDALIRDPSRLHRKDRGDVDVLENARLTFGDKEVTANILRSKVPAMLEMLDRLKRLIDHKSKKLPEYLKRCDVVDLIIADESGCLYWQEPFAFRAWLSHFLPKDSVMSSGFREIYLIFPTRELGEVSIGLRGSLLASELLAHINFASDSRELIPVVCACLSRSGFDDVHLSLVGDFYFFRQGPWAVEYRGETFSVRDLRLDLREDPNLKLSEVVGDFPQFVWSQAEQVREARAAKVVGVGVLLIQNTTDEHGHRWAYTGGNVVMPELPAPRLTVWKGSPRSR
jgi:hypothetical protein